MEANDTTAVNAKRFRKIAKMIRGLVDHIRKEKSLPEKLARETFDQVDDLAKEALIAPPRNCDVGKADEQIERFNEFCNSEWRDSGNANCGNCPLWVSGTIGHDCQIRWAQLPYENEAAE